MPTERDRQMVKHPLSPRILEEIGTIDSIPQPERGFVPDGGWSQSYRIWLNHGYYGLMNLEGGVLKLTRTNQDGDKFQLSVIQKFVNWEGIVQTVTADLICRNDDIASLDTWMFSSEFRDAADNPLPELSTRSTGKINGNTVSINVNNKGLTSRMQAAQRISADWCIFDAVQRLASRPAGIVKFDMLELLSVLKTDQEIRPMETGKDRPSFYTGEMTRFVQTGRGVLPWEYWLDSAQRLVFAFSGDRAYILDSSAEDIFEREVAKHREGGYSWQNQL